MFEGAADDDIQWEDKLIDELIDYDRKQEKEGTTASGWPRGQHDPTNHQTDAKEPFERTSKAISDILTDIADGKTTGEYPTVESIAKREPAATILKRGKADTEVAEELPVASPRRLIADIRPSMRERVAIIEHELKDAENATASLQREMYAQTHLIDKRVDNAHLRIDRDVLPAIKDLRDRRTYRTVLTWLGLLLSLAANIIAVYRYFNVKL